MRCMLGIEAQDALMSEMWVRKERGHRGLEFTEDRREGVDLGEVEACGILLLVP